MRQSMTSVLACLFLWCLHAYAEEAAEWEQLHTMGGPVTNSLVVRQDGSVLMSTYKFILEWDENRRLWDTLSAYENISMYRMVSNLRGEIFAGVIGGGVWKSEDGGKSWVQKSTEGTLSYVAITDLHVDSEGYIYACGESGIINDGKAMWYSRDNGESWLRFGNKEWGGDVGAMGWRADGVVVLCGGRGIYRSEDWGENFELVKQWGSGIQGEDVEVHGSGVVLVGSNVDGGFAWRSDTAGKNFTLIEAIESVAAITIDSLGRMYAFGRNQGLKVHRSLDTGKTWQMYNSGREGSNTVNDMLTAPDGHVYTGGMGIFRTTQRTHTHPVFWGKRGYCTAVEYMVIDSSVAEVELVDAESQNVQFQRLSPLGAGKVRIRLFLLDNSQSGVYTLRAVNAMGVESVYHDTLRRVSPEPELWRNGDTLWSNGGYVYQWYRDGVKLEGERKEQIVLGSEGVYRVLVENSRGCNGWSSEYAYKGTSVEEAVGTTTTGLFSAIPNPSNGEVALSYAIGSEGMVRLVVVDALGRELAVVVDAVQQVGTHRVAWDGKQLPMGVYMLRLEVAGSVYSQQLIIVR